MNFRTEIQAQKAERDINYKDKLMLIGSCFTENIGKKLSEDKFCTDINPFGIMYNPYSIEKALRILMEKRFIKDDELFLHDGVWNSFMHHGSFADISKETALEKINARIEYSSDALKSASHLIITFGTAWIYKQKETNEVVANCHKLPEKSFVRNRLTVQEIVVSYSHLLETIKTYNPDIEIIFTVSPIRHWKDGAHGNQLSKSTLLLAIDELQNKFSYAHYFPAYEIVMDELRDYRFYAEDMLHLTNATVEYIWEKFSDVYFSKKTKEIQKEISQIMKAESHRPFNPETEKHQSFLKKIEEKKSALKSKYPFINW